MVASWPIALGTTLGPTGVAKAVPFSMFNMLGEYSPSMLKSVHRTQGGRLEDTAANSLAREFAMHLSDVPMAAQMHVCAASLPPDGSELTQAGFHALPSRTVAPPHIVETPVAFECVLHEKLETASRYVFIGQVRWPSSAVKAWSTATLGACACRTFSRSGAS